MKFTLPVCAGCDRPITDEDFIKLSSDTKELWTGFLCSRCIKDALLERIFKPF